MTSLIILIDGLGDDPIPAWNGQTPFSRALHPQMDRLIREGSLSQVSICEEDVVPGSLTCILRLLGVPKEVFPTNRAYLELLAQNRDVSEYEMVLRCNVVSQDSGGRLVSFNGMGLSAREIVAMARQFSSLTTDIEFIHLSDYRNLLVMDRNENVLRTQTAPPHESMGLPVEELLAELKESSLAMKVFMQETDQILQQYNRNELTYKLYPWGASCRTEMPSFEALNGMKGALVCQTEIVRGIGKALKMEVPELSYCTADTDTNIREKLAVTRKMINRYPFVMTHFNGTDEAAHRHDYEGKAEFIARIDKEFLEPLLDTAEEPLRIVICGDHVTSSVTGKHTRGRGPVIAAETRTGHRPSSGIATYKDIVNYLMKESEYNG
ncbi:MAG TPA: hypothetical protein DEG55_07070 [Acidaminococcaceae bacterium]|nr:hypothetical protein [Acidaminococcaceae bacterium]